MTDKHRATVWASRDDDPRLYSERVKLWTAEPLIGPSGRFITPGRIVAGVMDVEPFQALFGISLERGECVEVLLSVTAVSSSCAQCGQMKHKRDDALCETCKIDFDDDFDEAMAGG